jgi:Zn finger protein HypA/HybF involved in hydrogenase expression
MESATYRQGACKCARCGLHFVVLEQILGEPTAFRLTCPECHRSEGFYIAKRGVDSFVFHSDPVGGEKAHEPQTLYYTQVACQCEDCLLDFVLCTWHPERHDKHALACPRCQQSDGRFKVARRLVAGRISEMVPGPGGW